MIESVSLKKPFARCCEFDVAQFAAKILFPSMYLTEGCEVTHLSVSVSRMACCINHSNSLETADSAVIKSKIELRKN